MPWKASELKPNPKNPRVISRVALSRLKESIRRDPKFMEMRPIIIDEENMILGGHQRLKACMSLGMKELPDGWVRRFENLTEEEKKRFLLIDNSPEEISGAFDTSKVDEWFKDTVKEIKKTFSGNFENFDENLGSNAARVLKQEDEAYKEFKAARKKSHEHGTDALDVDFYVCLVFDSAAQKQEFLDAMELSEEARYGKFVDGVAFSEGLGIQLTPSEEKPLNTPFDQGLADMALGAEAGGETPAETAPATGKAARGKAGRKPKTRSKPCPEPQTPPAGTAGSPTTPGTPTVPNAARIGRKRRRAAQAPAAERRPAPPTRTASGAQTRGRRGTT